MTRILARLGLGPGGGPLGRGDAALGRLRAARRSFDLSVVALRKAALDHVDCQDLASTALRANLDRLAHSLGQPSAEAGVRDAGAGASGGYGTPPS